MYKLLLVSDRDDVLKAFEEVQNWERLGFKPPHIRHDFEGTKDSLAKHHVFYIFFFLFIITFI